MTNAHHIPVLAQPVLQKLKDGSPQNNILDGTFGVGALTTLILQQTSAHVYALDCDPDAIARAKALQQHYPNRLTVLQGKFSQIPNLVPPSLVLDAAIFDCGVSSPQLDQANRGFSFQKDGPLDMRMSQTGTSAADVVNTFSTQQLIDVFVRFGANKSAKKVAHAIVSTRDNQPFSNTLDLAKLIERIVPKTSKIHPATLFFQAIRMHINNELSEIQQAVKNALGILRTQGILMMITFHSLEHKIVKDTMRSFTHKKDDSSRYHPPQSPKSSPNLPFTIEGFNRITKPSRQEILSNPRARSAQLRICIKI